MQNVKLKELVTMGMLGAIALFLMLFEVPLPFIAPSFYEMDFSEVPVLIGTFAMGPAAGVVIELLKIVLNLIITGTHTAYVGELGNFITSCAFIVPAGIIYRKFHTRRGAVIGMSCGTVCLVIAGCLMNAFVLLPLYANLFMGGIDNVIAAGTAVNGNINSIFTFVVIAVAPFNLIKGFLVSLVVSLIYKRISVIIHGFIAEKKEVRARA